MHADNVDFKLLSEEIQKYVQQYFNEHINEKFLYHDLSHTEGVVNAVTEIANHYKISEQDLFVVTTDAWFHDIGYFAIPENHEIEGAAIAEKFLKEKNISDETIIAVKDCIIATTIPQKPKGLLEEIICDADLFQFGTDKFFERNKLIKKEREELSGKKIKKKEWLLNGIQLLEKHHFFTSYCQNLLAEHQNKNMEELKKKMKKEENKETVKDKNKHPKKVKLEKREDEKRDDEIDQLSEVKAKDAPASRGIQTMFRMTSSNNQKLSDMADNKAHIMISVNSIILSLILGMLLRKLDPYNPLFYPSILFIAVSLSTIIFSVLATRPSIPKGVFTEKELTDKKVNLLFFGNFYKMSLDEYSAGMYKVMEDRNFLYQTLIRDVYSQGKVLGRKYHLLRVSYNIFMFGLIASVCAYIAAILFFSPITLKEAIQPLKDTDSTKTEQTIIYKSPTGYNLVQPEIISVPSALNEVSGIAFNNGNSDTIYSQQDENAKLFRFKNGDTNAFETKFGKAGDYEDLAICKNFVILLKSNGEFVTFPLRESKSAVVKNAKDFKSLIPDGEYESLGAIQETSELYVLCKQEKGNNNNLTKGYTLKLSEKGDLVSNAEFEIDTKEIEEKARRKKIDFKPSGLAMNPCTKEWYIISSVNKLLVIADSDWHIKDVFPLTPSIFKQPEGIAFDANCNLFISNEKNSGSPASILKFNYE